MENRRILIVGAGIAGPTLAYWLLRYGFEPTLVERAPHLRSGGYVIDFAGIGYDVAEKMNLLPALRQHGLPMERLTFVDGNGKARGGIGARAISSLTGKRFVSLLRSDLAREIFGLLDNVRTIFGDTVTNLHQDPGGVLVEFRNAPAERFDLVVGAGGLHSPLRSLLFGPESSFEEFLGYYAASFIATDYPNQQPRTYISYAQPGRQVTRYTLQDGRTVFLFVFAAKEKLVFAHDTNFQKEVLHSEFRDAGWECTEILRRLNDTNEIYFDAVSQIRMQRWSRNRSTLVGDACACPSLLAGQGSSLAMGAAYILAGELKVAAGNHRAAFARYERTFHPVIEKKQRAAKRFARSFVPNTRAGIAFRNHVTRLMNIPWVAHIAFGQMLDDSIALPCYERLRSGTG
jgi:2-polyprenyl-6-methoxyphenol hydroxylase-like FAD-dependent oxidoreductase